MLPFDVILFDVGGVLLTNGWDTRERAQVLKNFDVDRAAFEALHEQYYRLWDVGAISALQYLDATVFSEPRGFSHEEFFNAICNLSIPLQNGALGILKELAASDKCLLGALNNEARETNEYRFETFGLRRYFKVSLSSCYLGLRKPDMAIFQRALDILGCAPERILFIDDRMENIAGAVRVEMRAILFEGEEKLRRELVERGVFTAPTVME